MCIMAGEQPHTVSVKTTARAHLGFMDPSGRGARPFGSVGVTLDRPHTHVLMSSSDQLVVDGIEAERGEKFICRLADYFGTDTAVNLKIEEAIPAHAGLGSGTQLAIAVGTAYATLMGLETNPREIAMVLGRGKRSGIGIGAFEYGGLILDGGPNAKGGVAPILSRIPFPAKWRILLVFEPNRTALHGEGEIKAFQELPDFPDEAVAELCRRTVLGLLPAAAEEDFDGFCRNVQFLQESMGQYFAPVQGGHYTSPHVGEVIQWAKDKGFQGVGQSSWGPTGIVFVESEERGKALVKEAKAKWRAQGNLEFALASGLNRGAIINRVRTSQKDVGGEVGQPA